MKFSIINYDNLKFIGLVLSLSK